MIVRGALWGSEWTKQKQPQLDGLAKLVPEGHVVARDNAIRTADGRHHPIPTPETNSEPGPKPGSKSFALFTDLNALVSYNAALPAPIRNMYEVCDMTRPMRLGFDIDFKFPAAAATAAAATVATDLGIDTASRESFLRSRESFLRSILAHIIPFMDNLCRRPFSSTDFAALDACDATKLSFHLVTDAVAPPELRSAVRQAIRTHFTYVKLAPTLDTSVYANDQNIRLPYNSKIGSSRVLLPVNSVGDLHFRPTPTHFCAELLAVHMWSVTPANPIAIYLDAVPPRAMPAPGSKRDRGDAGRASDHADIVHRNLGETNCRPRASSQGDGTCWVMTKGLVRHCPTGETHSSQGFVTHVDHQGQVKYTCFAATCSGRVFTLGPAVVCNNPPRVVRHPTTSVAWREFDTNDVPHDLWRQPYDAVLWHPAPWRDAVLIKEAFGMDVHVFRKECGPYGAIMHEWQFNSHDPCPVCAQRHLDPFYPYKVRVREHATTPLFYAPCQTTGVQLVRHDTDDEFDAHLIRVQQAEDKLGAALSLLVWSAGSAEAGERRYLAPRPRRNGHGETYTYRELAVGVRYDSLYGFRLECKSSGGGTFPVEAKGHRSKDASLRFHYTV